ncbi:hypothetical protein J6590_035930 [Homalodisca vitripennis]|nr:hypothetical protein J6590_035930 [Homalodisca vitripennis]
MRAAKTTGRHRFSCVKQQNVIYGRESMEDINKGAASAATEHRADIHTRPAAFPVTPSTTSLARPLLSGPGSKTRVGQLGHAVRLYRTTALVPTA